MNIVIKKAGIVSGLFLSYEFEQTDSDIKNTIKTSSDAPIHEDMKAAFRNLIPHFTYICEEVLDIDLIESAMERPESYLEDPEHSASEVFFKYNVHEFSIKGKGDSEQVSFSGSKSLTSGKNISFTTPALYIDSADYKFSDQLIEAVEVLKKEVLQYMQGKQAPKAQLEMFAENDGSDQDNAFMQE